MFEPPVTESEAKSEGFELEDYETELVEVWPDNELALDIFRRVGTRWRSPPMGGVPIGLQWEAIYPLMERKKLDDDRWNDLHDDLMLLESTAVEVMREFAAEAGA